MSERFDYGWVWLAGADSEGSAGMCPPPPFPLLLPQLPLSAKKNRNTLIEHSFILMEQSSILTELIKLQEAADFYLYLHSEIA